jgi:hypothetical protein
MLLLVMLVSKSDHCTHCTAFSLGIVAGSPKLAIFKEALTKLAEWLAPVSEILEA